MSDTKVFSFPENSGGGGNDLATLLALSNGNGNNGLLNGNGLGGGILGFFLGLLCGNGGIGNGLFGGGRNNTEYLGNMISNDTGRQLLMQAITEQGTRAHDAVQTLSTMLGQDFNLVNANINTITSALNNIATQQAVSVPQLINSIQSGNASLASQLCQCCCENRAAIADQTAALQSALNTGFGNVQQTLASKAAADQLAICQQTYTLTDTANRNNQAIINKLEAMETRALQDKLDLERDKNTQLNGEVSQMKQNQYFAGVVGQSLAPINAQLASLAKEVDDIKCKQPNTVNVQYPNLTAVPTGMAVGMYAAGYPYYGYNAGGGFWG